MLCSVYKLFMKKALLFGLLIAVAIGHGCRKAKGPANIKSAQPDNSIDSLLNMTADINGVRWETDSAYSYRVKNSGNDSNVINLMVIASRKKDSVTSTFKFNITNFTGIGNYPILPPMHTATYYYGSIRYFATSGMFTVIKDTGGVLSGTFHFIADTIDVSNGTFVLALP
jgi:hypothetical protein